MLNDAIYLLTLIKNDNNSFISKQRNIYSCEIDQKYFIEFSTNKVVEKSDVHTNAVVSINTENNRLMCSTIIRTSCEKETENK